MRSSESYSCIHHSFEYRVRMNPNKVCLSFKNKSLTYSQANQRANLLAQEIIKQGVANDDLIGLCAERGFELIIGILAILKCACAYVPIDPKYPKERRGYLIKDSGIKLLLVDNASEELVENEVVNKIIIPNNCPNTAVENPDLIVGKTNLAYVIYTSGTTGQPKGVLVEHHNVLRLFHETNHWFSFSNNDIWTLFHSVCFDFSVWELWGALLFGGTLVIVPYAVTRKPEQFYNLVCEEKITVLNQTPSAFRGFIAANGKNINQHELSLRYVIFGGESLDVNMLKGWFNQYGNSVELINMYGITETTVHVTYKKISSDFVHTTTSNSIGKPIPDLKLFLLDQQKNLLTKGEVGEIYIAGEGLARGYLNRPALNAERFLAIPHLDEGRFYRTGDLALEDTSGDFIYKGRVDNQIKLNGFRIEPEEIENLVKSKSNVLDAIILVKHFDEGDKQLISFVLTSQEDLKTLSDELNVFFKNTLPIHMRPYKNIVLNEFPITANGKIDKKALLASIENLESNNKHSLKAISQTIESVWKSALETSEYDYDDDFFDLGGSSLALVRMLSTISDVFNIQLEMSAFFDGMTLASLIKEVEKNKNIKTIHPSNNGTKENIKKIITDIWNETVEVDEVDENDDFFDLGGSSLALVRMMSAIDNRFNITLEMKDFLDGITLGLLIENVEKKTKMNIEFRADSRADYYISN